MDSNVFKQELAVLRIGFTKQKLPPQVEYLLHQPHRSLSKVSYAHASNPLHRLSLLRIYKSLRQYKVIVKQLPQANAMSTEMSVAMQQDIHPIESV